jgi:hypothetical protein
MTDYEIRQQVLQHLYDNRRTHSDGLSVPNIAESLELDIETIKTAARQLDDLYQVRYEKTIGGKGTVTITTDGVTEIEGVGGSTPITVNQNTFNTSSESGNSNVNVGDGTFNSTQTTNISVTDIIEKLNALEAPPEEKEEAKSLVTQLTHNPLICAVVGGAVSGLV